MWTFKTLPELSAFLGSNEEIARSDLRLFLDADEFVTFCNSPVGLHIQFILRNHTGVYEAFAAAAQKTNLMHSRNQFTFVKGGGTYLAFQLVAAPDLREFLTHLPFFVRLLREPGAYRLEILRTAQGFVEDHIVSEFQP
jgi:hypothetical protein